MIDFKNQILKYSHLLIVALIIFIWIKFWLQDSDEFLSKSPISNASAGPSQNLINYKKIGDFHIFGSAQELYDVPSMPGKSTLDFVLNGTMSRSIKTTGVAYISNAKGVQKRFEVGEKVFDSAILKEVHKNYVVLEHNGKNERLMSSENNRASEAAVKLNQNKKNNSIYAKHLSGGQKNNQNWDEVMKQQKFDPAKIKNIVQNSNIVVDQSGKIRGVRVSNLSNGGLLTKFGLKSNDIITAVNGNLVNESNLFKIQQEMTKSQSATLTIKRNGKTQNIQISLPQN